MGFKILIGSMEKTGMNVTNLYTNIPQTEVI